MGAKVVVRRVGLVLFCAVFLLLAVFGGLVLFMGKAQVKRGDLYVNGLKINNKYTDVRKEKFTSYVLPFLDELAAKVGDLFSRGYHYHADLPLTRVLKGLGMDVKWADDNTAHITYRNKKYVLNLAEVSFAEEGKEGNLISPVPGGQRTYKVLERELVLDGNTVMGLLARLGMKASIEIDFENAAVFVTTFKEGVVNAIERVGRDKNGNDLFDIRWGEKKLIDMVLLEKTEGTSKRRPMTVELYGKSSKNDYLPTLAVRRGKQLLIFQWEVCNQWIPKIYLADVDGDGEDEIVYHNPIFNGHSPLHVLKLEEDSLIELYRFPQYKYKYYSQYSTFNMWNDLDLKKLNFGFVGRLADGYKLVLEYPDLDFKREIDLSDGKYFFIDKSLYFDKHGKPLKPYVREIEPKLRELYFSFFLNPLYLDDYDKDGAVEILCLQAVGFGFNEQVVGFSEVGLKYNRESKAMDVVFVEFVEIEGKEQQGKG